MYTRTCLSGFAKKYKIFAFVGMLVNNFNILNLYVIMTSFYRQTIFVCIRNQTDSYLCKITFKNFLYFLANSKYLLNISKY